MADFIRAVVGGDSCLYCVHLIVKQTDKRWLGVHGNEKLLKICNPFVVEYCCDTDNKFCPEKGWVCEDFFRKKVREVTMDGWQEEV